MAWKTKTLNIVQVRPILSERTPATTAMNKIVKGSATPEAALKDAGIDSEKLSAAFVGNAAAGLITGQESIRGEVILRSIGIGKITGAAVGEWRDRPAAAFVRLPGHCRPVSLCVRGATLSRRR